MKTPKAPPSKLEPEYKDLYTAWKTAPDKTNTGNMLRALNPVFDNAIRAYAPDMRGSPIIKSRARQLATDALQSYDESRGSMRSHMLTQLQRLRRIAGTTRQIIQTPEQVARDQMHLTSAAANLSDRYGRPPSDQELADHLGLSMRRIEYIRSGTRPIAEGSLQQAPTGDDDVYEPPVADLNRDHTADLEFIYDDLTPTDQYVMENIFGMHGLKPISASDVARKLGVSPASISHRTANIQKKLDELASYGGL
jgi:DNA-directed RNA polymerase specialized sigma subunit